MTTTSVGIYEFNPKDLIGHGAFAVVYKGRVKSVSLFPSPPPRPFSPNIPNLFVVGCLIMLWVNIFYLLIYSTDTGIGTGTNTVSHSI